MGRNGRELHLRPGDHRRLDSSNARQNRATRPSFLPSLCSVALQGVLLCPEPQTIERGNKGGPSMGWVGPGAPWLHRR